MHPLRRPAAEEFNPYYEGYIGQVKGNDFLDQLRTQQEATTNFLQNIDSTQWNYRYESGKWTVKEVVIHLIDTERIFAYRALRIARGDKTPIPGFDENKYVPAANAAARSSASIINEYQMVRNATISLFENLDQSAYSNMGTASDSPLSTLAAAYIIAGHELHHLKVLQERYF